MRLVFIGSSKFGLKCLTSALGMSGCEVVGAVTAPSKFPISYRPKGVVNVLHADVEGYCTRQGIPFAVIQKGMRDDALFDKVSSWRPDAFLVAGWYHMIPKRWRDLAPAYGLHASLLPDYSGGAPLVWAMINGETKTGITFFQFDDGVDSGPIVGQADTEINDDDDIATLYARVEELGLALLAKHMPAIASDTAVLALQDESRRRIFPQRGPEDGMIDWSKPASYIINFIRAQTRPYPGAFTIWQGRRLKVWVATKSDTQDVPLAIPGEVLAEPNTLLVKTGSGVLELNEVDYEGEAITGQMLRDLVADKAVLGN